MLRTTVGQRQVIVTTEIVNYFGYLLLSSCYHSKRTLLHFIAITYMLPLLTSARGTAILYYSCRKNRVRIRAHPKESRRLYRIALFYRAKTPKTFRDFSAPLAIRHSLSISNRHFERQKRTRFRIYSPQNGRRTYSISWSSIYNTSFERLFRTRFRLARL